jgi:hypothetical protein
MSPQARKPDPTPRRPEEEEPTTTSAEEPITNPVLEEALERGVLLFPDAAAETTEED